MYCKFCGKEIPESSKFCRYCGRRIGDTASYYPEVELNAECSSKGSFVSKVSKTTIELVVTILVIINFFSGIIGGIWLALSGGLSLVIYGIILSIAMPWAYTIAFLPQMGSMLLLSKLEESGNKILVAIFGFIVSIYGNIILAIWSVIVFENLVVGRSQHILPLLFWSYSTVMAPLSYMVSKEPPDSTGTSMGLLFAQLSFILLTVLFLVGGYDSARNVALGILILLFSSLTISAVVSSMRAQRTQPIYSE